MKMCVLVIALLMVIAQPYGYSYPEMVDNTLDAKSKSELHPVADAAKLTGVVNDGVNKVIEHKAISPVMEPIETVRKETLKGGYKITNTLWDFLTFRSFRSKKSAE